MGKTFGNRPRFEEHSNRKRVKDKHNFQIDAETPPPLGRDEPRPRMPKAAGAWSRQDLS